MRTFRLTTILFLLTSLAISSGKVYLVIGSDTALWDGMDVAQFHCSYTLDLFTLQSRNAYLVMEPSFRQQFVDSYGTPLKMTWWMMAGNIFRYAVNTNVPVPNTMTLYLMKKYHGDMIQRWGDELTLHYHTFAWTDYNQDGKWYWNQAKRFTECRDDFDYTLAQFLLEENTFPVSFRSGWHAMDNDWQHYLNQVISFSMHNDYPAVRVDTTEPIDNVFDWSKAPSRFVPFRPSDQNYQLPGGGKGWNVRSIYMANMTQSRMDTVFAQAAAGIDQVVCIWAHLPETDFLTNIQHVDSVAQVSAGRYSIPFRYTTAVEAMQRWMGTADLTPPAITVAETNANGTMSLDIQTDEPIFQNQPFVALKDVYEQYSVLSCQQISPQQWHVSVPLPQTLIAKIGIAVTDSLGNLTTKILWSKPDDQYIDNSDTGYHELKGAWSASASKSWGLDSRIATLSSSDTVTVQWETRVNQSGLYHQFIQIPKVTNLAANYFFLWRQGNTVIDSVFFSAPLATGRWIYLRTVPLDSTQTVTVELSVAGTGQSGKIVCADVFKLSPLVREKDLRTLDERINVGSIAEEDTLKVVLHLANYGSQQVSILSLSSLSKTITMTAAFPVVIQPMQELTLPLQFTSTTLGALIDTLSITCDDFYRPSISLPFTASVERYFEVADNDDSLGYREYGDWRTSVAQAYGASSRYTFVNPTPGAYALYTTTLRKSGVYAISYILPTTVNSSKSALYTIAASGITIDSVYLDQNQNSGAWVIIGTYVLQSGSDVQVKVANVGTNVQGDVLRADAIKIALTSDVADVASHELLPDEFILSQNYPNPFNPETILRYELPVSSLVRLVVYDLMGREVATLVNEEKPAGWYSVTWNAKGFSSGIYFICLRSGNTMQWKKMVLLK